MPFDVVCRASKSSGGDSETFYPKRMEALRIFTQGLHSANRLSLDGADPCVDAVHVHEQRRHTMRILGQGRQAYRIL